LIHQEIALYKIATEKLMAMSSIESLIRQYNIKILDMNETFVVFLKSGHYAETQQLFEELSNTIGVLQFVRSGRIAITKAKVERLSDMLDAMRQIDENPIDK
jgi:acetolactate synthase-1/3 small subunit